VSSQLVTDKLNFFQTLTPATTLVEVEQWAAEKDFRFLHQTHDSHEQELDDQKITLKNSDDNRRRSWLYCYYTACMLKNYYEGYSAFSANAIKYAQMKEALRKQLENEADVPPVKEGVLETIFKDAYELTLIPFSNAKLRRLSGKTNLHRLSTRFSMLTVQQTLLLAKQYHYLDNLEWLMGRQVNIAALDAPVSIYYAASVFLLGFRFILDLSMLLKHTLLPTPEESQLNMGERFYEEVKKRHYRMVNDIVWSTVNGLCNYAQYFHIPAPVANYLMIGFSAFDVIWLGYLLYTTDRNFEQKRKDCEECLKVFKQGTSEYLAERKRLDDLWLAHEKARAEVIFYMAAAGMMMGSFTAVFLLSPPALVPVCFLVCTLAVAMYLSGSQYAEYKEKSLILKDKQDKHLVVTAEDKKNLQDAWDNLCFAMTKNTLAPMVIMGAFTISFPLAILLTVAYMAYENGYLTRVPELFPKPALA
jgi:hypothetical protein